MKTNKITKTTFKSFIKKNAGNLYVNMLSTFDGMIDGLRFSDNGFYQAISTDMHVEHTYGVDQNVWLVGSSRDYFDHYEDDQFTGIKVINSCGSFIVAIKKAKATVQSEIVAVSEAISMTPESSNHDGCEMVAQSGSCTTDALELIYEENESMRAALRQFESKLQAMKFSARYKMLDPKADRDDRLMAEVSLETISVIREQLVYFFPRLENE